MLVELNVVEQRYRAVLDVLEGASVIEVVRRNGVTRQTVHEWLRRYAGEGGLVGLADRSSRPASCPHQMAPEVEARIVAMRRAHPAWGPDRIRWQLARDDVDLLPGRSSVYRALIRHNLVEAKKRRRRREDYRRWERSRSMELWQMDVMGRLHLADGRECKVVTGIDDPFTVRGLREDRGSGHRSSGLWCVVGGVAPARHPGADPDGQWQGLHGPVRSGSRAGDVRQGV